LQVRLANRLGLLGDEEGARKQWQLIKSRFPHVTIERCLWFFRQSMPEEKVQGWVEGPRRDQLDTQ